MKRVFIVAGANGSIGRSVAQGLADQGYRVVAFSRSLAPDVSRNASGSVYDCTVRCDYESENSLAEAFRIVAESYPCGVSGLVNAAGVGLVRQIRSTSSDDFMAVVRANLLVPFLLTKHFALGPHPGNPRRVLHIGSTADHIGFENSSAYCGSKFGLRGLVQASNAELSRDGIYSTLVSLGATDTRIWDDRAEFSRADMLQPSDVGRHLASIVSESSNMRIDEIKLFPPKGVL